jgi:hypothetical protein
MTETTPNAAARPNGWLIRIGDSDMWPYCDNEEDADFYGKQSGLKYEKLALYTAADYDALRAEVEKLRFDVAACAKAADLFRIERRDESARADAAEAKHDKLHDLSKQFLEAQLALSNRELMGQNADNHSKLMRHRNWALEELDSALNEGGE